MSLVGAKQLAGAKSHRKIRGTKHGGFTLIEMVLALSIFSLILLMIYQALIASTLATKTVSTSVSKQTELRSAYRTLDNAFATGASLIGSKYTVKIDLATSDDAWLEGAQTVDFEISDNNVLWAYVDSPEQASLLSSALLDAEFRYLDQGVVHTTWTSIRPPQAIELSWNESGELHRWRFKVP